MRLFGVPGGILIESLRGLSVTDRITKIATEQPNTLEIGPHQLYISAVAGCGYFS